MQPVQSHYWELTEGLQRKKHGNSALEIIFATLIQKDQGKQLSLDVNVLICGTGIFL